MKTLFASFGWLLLLLPFISLAGTRTLLHSTNRIVSSEERTVNNFSGVSSSGSYDVYIRMGTKEELRLEGDGDIIKHIETRVENGILKIRHTQSKRGWNWSREKVKIYITAKTIKNLTISGSGSVEVSGTIREEKLSTQVSGSGSMRMNIQAKTLNAAVSGSGSLRVSGSANDANISLSGSGEFKGKELKTSTTAIKVSGSGNATVYTVKQLNASLSGSGNISYSGNPQVNQRKSGSGRISRL